MTTVYIPTPLRRTTGGQSKVEAAGRSMRALLDALERTYPGIRQQLCDETGEVRSFINIFVNGTEIRQLEGLSTPVQDGDEVSIIPAMAGGRGKSVARKVKSPASRRVRRALAAPRLSRAGMPATPEEVYDTVLEVIGRTPLVRLHKVTRGIRADLVAKLEYLNPGGSVKDRIGPAMIEDAERRGLLRPGGTIVEATSGNTGVGVAIAAAVRGYRTIFVMPDKMSEEKIRLLRAFGARVIITPTAVAPEDPRSYYNVSRRIAEETPNSFYANQYANPANPHAHYDSPGPAIWRQRRCGRRRRAEVRAHTHRDGRRAADGSDPAGLRLPLPVEDLFRRLDARARHAGAGTGDRGRPGALANYPAGHGHPHGCRQRGRRQDEAV